MPSFLRLGFFRQKLMKIGIVGFILGALSTFLSYGVGGGLILSLAIGTVVILFRENRSRPALTFFYSLSAVLGFHVLWGFHFPSTRLSDRADHIWVWAGFVFAPVLVALLLEAALWTRDNLNPKKTIGQK